jgi:nucleoside-diphosphate-sugar epimerase
VRTFVTGGTGFVGSHLVEALMDRGDEVVCLVRDPRKAARLFTDRQPDTVLGDLTNERALRDGCDGAEVVFHLAGVTAARDRAQFFEINAAGTRRVLEAAGAAAPALRRFVYISSLSATGPTARGHLLTESVPPRPISDYGASKLAAEEATREGRLPWNVVRPPAVYGPRDTEMARAFKLARWGLAPVFGDGSQELSLIHVSDLVAALLAAVDSAPADTTYFAAHPEIVAQRELQRAIHAAVLRARGGKAGGLRRPLVVPLPGFVARGALQVTGTTARLLGRTTVLSPDKGPEFLAEAWTCSPAALERDTGWRAEIPIAVGLEETARWYHQHRWL